MRSWRKRDLERVIGSIPPHPSPRVELEQYATPPHVASRLLWIAAFTYDDVFDREVVDLGAGTGRLGLAAALLGARRVLLVDVDPKALRIALEHGERLGVSEVLDALASDVRALALRKARFDVAIQNPPFGVHRRGADVEFLLMAMSLARVVYTIHKTSSVDYVVRRAVRAGWRVEKLFSDVILIPPIYAFHEERAHRVDVTALRVVSHER